MRKIFYAWIKFKTFYTSLSWQLSLSLSFSLSLPLSPILHKPPISHSKQPITSHHCLFLVVVIDKKASSPVLNDWWCKIGVSIGLNGFWFWIFLISGFCGGWWCKIGVLIRSFFGWLALIFILRWMSFDFEVNAFCFYFYFLVNGFCSG